MPGAKKRIGRRKRTVHKESTPQVAGKPLPEPSPSAQRNISICILLILLAFGVYRAVVLFGAIPVPNPDYSGYVQVGREILSFQNPSTYKRPPVLGIMQIATSKLMFFSDNPILSGSWLLNAILGTMIGILAWLVGREIIGDSAVWFAIVLMLNPWVLRSQATPIAEVPMVFFILATLFFMFKHSNWCYVFASLASMVRYECSALIFIAFLMDMVYRKSKKERLYALLYTFCASVPFLLWMLGTAVNWESSSSGHYLHHYGRGAKGGGFIKFLTLLWHSSIGVLSQWPSAIKAMFIRPTTRQQADAINSAVNILSDVSMIVAVVGCAAAFVGGVIRRNWNLLAIMFFACVYTVAHSIRVNTHTRYCVPVIALALLVVWAGLRYIWQLINKNDRLHKSVIITLQIVSLIVILLWLSAYLFYLPKTKPLSVRLAALPYVALAAAVAVFLVRLYLLRARTLRADLVLLALASAFIVSEHFTAARTVGNGTYNIEFKQLADWYIANAKDGEKLACTWASLLKLLAEKHKDNFIDLKACRADTFDGIVDKCHEKNITYVAWTVRGSKKVKRGLDEIYVLKEPRDRGPFEFVHRIDLGRESRWINIFRLQRPFDENADINSE